MAATLLALVLLTAGCGGEKKKDPAPEIHGFHTSADAAPFGGPVPLTIKFSADSYKASGGVHYRWRFDDGTTSDQQNPTHTFTQPSYYQVGMQATDEKGHKSVQSLLVGAWPPKVWVAAQKRQVSSKQLLNEVQEQRRRTKARGGAAAKALEIEARQRRELRRRRQAAKARGTGPSS